ncbi:MAG TPA: hypothetical protein VLA14_15750 [Polyangia bacterium]|nr:hypothetical protein [Polyangia bacterium]
MDFDEFEQLVLKVLFETDVPVTAAHVAYLGRVSVRTAERHLARMVEHGTLHVRTSVAGVVEYIYPGRKPLVQPNAAGPGFGMVGPPPISAGDAYFLTLRPKPNPDGRHVVDADPWRGAHLRGPRRCGRRVDGDDAHGLRLLLPSGPLPARPLPRERGADAPELS